jgi:hypothetical protein
LCQVAFLYFCKPGDSLIFHDLGYSSSVGVTMKIFQTTTKVNPFCKNKHYPCKINENFYLLTKRKEKLKILVKINYCIRRVKNLKSISDLGKFLPFNLFNER